MKTLSTAAALLLALGAHAYAAGPQGAAAKGPEWDMNATVIEACSCTMFCQCYFNTKPGAHHEHGASKHFCRYNNVYKVNRGHYGEVKLDGAKFWFAGDLGDDFSDGDMEWAVLYFDKATTKEQREGIQAIVGALFPVKWKSFTTAEGEISWAAGKGEAHALLDGGKSGEVKLTSKVNSDNPGESVVIKNLKYWGATRNDGFVLMPNEVEAYRVGDKAFEYKGTNGFMLTLDIDSKSVASAGKAAY